jgi:hypothetical protein
VNMEPFVRLDGEGISRVLANLPEMGGCYRCALLFSGYQRFPVNKLRAVKGACFRRQEIL